MRRLLRWATRDEVARTNAAQASVRLQHERHARDDSDAFVAQHEAGHRQQTRADEPPRAGRIPAPVEHRP